jgi:translation initiation factor 3 subunit A
MVKPEESYCPEAREDRQARLAQLLNLTAQPSRRELVQDMQDMNIMAFVNPNLKDLFSVLEDEFHPLQLCQKVSFPEFPWVWQSVLLTNPAAVGIGATHL